MISVCAQYLRLITDAFSNPMSKTMYAKVASQISICLIFFLARAKTCYATSSTKLVTKAG